MDLKAIQHIHLVKLFKSVKLLRKKKKIPQTKLRQRIKFGLQQAEGTLASHCCGLVAQKLEGESTTAKLNSNQKTEGEKIKFKPIFLLFSNLANCSLSSRDFYFLAFCPHGAEKTFAAALWSCCNTTACDQNPIDGTILFQQLDDIIRRCLLFHSESTIESQSKNPEMRTSAWRAERRLLWNSGSSLTGEQTAWSVFDKVKDAKNQATTKNNI